MNLPGYISKYKDDRFYIETFELGVYDPVKELGKVDTVIDIGALAGEFSFWMHDSANKIYAIEPFIDHYKELESNIKEFEFDKVKPFRLAISNKNRKGHMINSNRGGQMLSLDEGKQDEVPVFTLAQFMKDQGIESVDVLKIDVEDHENLIFNAPDFPTVADKIKFIIGEHTSGHKETLERLGFVYEVFKYGFIYKRK